MRLPGVYLNFTFMSADLYSWSADLTSSLDWPWKTTPIWPLISEIPWCVSQFYLHVSWFVQLTSWFDITTGFALKNYPNLTFNMLNSLVCISIYGNFTFMSADLYRWSADLSSLTADLTPPSDLYRKSNPHWCLTCCSLTSTGPKNYQTIPNQLKIEIWTENINLNNFYPWQHYDFWPYFRVTKSDFRFFKFFQFSRARLKKKFSWAKTLGHCELKSRISGS